MRFMKDGDRMKNSPMAMVEKERKYDSGQISCMIPFFLFYLTLSSNDSSKKKLEINKRPARSLVGSIPREITQHNGPYSIMSINVGINGFGRIGR